MSATLAILGGFIFSSNKKELHTIRRETQYRYAKIEKIAGETEYHPVGTQEEEITLIGGVNAIEGGKDPLWLLRLMASERIAYPLFIGDGDYLGSFIVERISESGEKLWINGVALEIGFEIGLTRVDEGSLLSWIL